jgi:hypothetical protein
LIEERLEEEEERGMCGWEAEKESDDKAGLLLFCVPQSRPRPVYTMQVTVRAVVLDG